MPDQVASADTRPPPSSPPPSPALFPSPCQLFWLLAGYFILQVILRVGFSSSVDLDESEQVVLGQKFCWGYGSDPPLYTWLQIPFFRLLGESVLALSVLKNLLLLGIYWLTFIIARRVSRTSAAAVAAALSVFYLPEVAWESQRDLTHTILSADLALATLYFLLLMFETRQTRWYLLFGLSAGLGLLSKFNYAFWLLGLLLGAATIPELRPALLDRRGLFGLLLGFAVFLPNALWMLRHRDLALLTASKFDVRQSLDWFHVVRLGAKNLAQSVIGFGAPLALIYALVFLKTPIQEGELPESNQEYRGLILRAWLVIGVVLAGLVVFARATGFKERWFQPILISMPIVAATFIANRLDALRLRVLFAISVCIMLAVAIVMPGRLLAAERLKREEPLTRPYARLAAQLDAVIPPNSLVVCDTRLLAGNLRLGLLQDCVLPAELTGLMGGRHAHCFLVWGATSNSPLPDSLRQWASASAANAVSGAAPGYFTAPYRYHHTKQYCLGLVQAY